MSNIKLSIVIPVFNTGEYFLHCLESIVEQESEEFEVIIIDDGSDDLITKKICDDFEKKYRFIKVFHIKNGGVSNARNKGIKEASGEYIWFVDSDDLVKEGSIDTIISNMGKADLLVFGIEEFNKKNKFIHSFDDSSILVEDVAHRLLQENDMRGYLFNKVFRVAIIRDNKLLFDDKIKVCEDLLFCVDYINNIESANTIHDVLYLYRQRRGGAVHSMINADQSTALNAFCKIIKRCRTDDSRIKAEALFMRAFHKYKMVMPQEWYNQMRVVYEECRTDWKSFSRRDKRIILGYRYFYPLMLFLHKRQHDGKWLYE